MAYSPSPSSIPHGVLAYAGYVPRPRLNRSAIRAALGSGGGKGTRAVASYDEDTTSMGVEAARIALRGNAVAPDQLFFATADPAYLDKTNATAIHAALGLDSSVLAADFGGAVRSGIAALLAASSSINATLVVTADTRTGLPGGADEAAGGDAAAAIVVGLDTDATPVLAELIADASTTAEFLDRWRTPGARASKQWEERFGEQAYLPLANEALTAALKSADLTPDAVDVLIVSGLHARAARAFAAQSGVAKGALSDDLTAVIGNAGTAQPGLLLAAALDTAAPQTTIALVVLADGASATIWRTTDALPEHRAAVSVAEQIAAGDESLSYPTFLTWKGQLDREPPRRPDPAAPFAPPSMRRSEWKFGFVGSTCTACGTKHLPPVRVCQQCHAVDEMTSEGFSDVGATVSTFTVDRLAFTPSPPLIGVVIDFDGGGRFSCELTDADAASVAIGDRVEMTFRRVLTAGGVHNYFWKARPARALAPSTTKEGQ